MKKHAEQPPETNSLEDYEGNDERMISTGSTLLDLAISGGRKRGGGLPGGIMVEIFGPPGCGKTVMLCEIAGNIQRQGGEVDFSDPEGRLNEQFVRMFMNVQEVNQRRPDTVNEVFDSIPKWEPPVGVINGIMCDGFAALSTDMEMEKEDKMGMLRAKQFSTHLRKTCRILANKNYLMVASNQIRENVGAGTYEPKFKSTGGFAIPHYASLRLRCMNPQKIKITRKVHGVDAVRTIGVETEIRVEKSTVWKPYHEAKIYILFDYGIDDIRANLRFMKEWTKSKTYMVDGQNVGLGLDQAIHTVETNRLRKKLRREVIDLWEEIESKFRQERVPKRTQ